MVGNASFSSFLLAEKELYRNGDTTLYGICGKTAIDFTTGTSFVYIHTGVGNWNGENLVKAGAYGCFTSGYLRTTDTTTGFVIHQQRYKGLQQIGGQVERYGRLRYIDGCTDTLLVPPVKKGDPCLNYLHFPSGTSQTPHTHPSDRIGMVVRGKGYCVTPFGTMPLWAGQVFVIHAATGARVYNRDHVEGEVGLHAFKTDYDELGVVAFHPDSDWGATDDDHPMLNRTYVDGVSMRGRA